MRKFVSLICATALATSQFASVALAAPGDRQMPQRGAGPATRQAPAARPAPSAMRPSPSVQRPSPGMQRPSPGMQRPSPGMQRPSPGIQRPMPNVQRPSPNVQRPMPNVQRPTPNYGSGRPVSNRPDYNRPGNRPDNRPGNNRPEYNRPGGNTVIVNRPNRYPTYPVYRPPGGGYYRPPNGGYYRPPRPPYGGWHGGYFPPPRYYYNDGPSVGGILFGVAVTTSLLALLSASNQPDTVYIQGSPPPPPYQPPSNANGIPASINVDLNGMPAAARPSASTCLTEAARQIGATGGTEIRIDKLVDIEQGNGGYRFRLELTAVYPDQTRLVPMYCRATPEKIVELTFG